MFRPKNPREKNQQKWKFVIPTPRKPKKLPSLVSQDRAVPPIDKLQLDNYTC